MSENHKERFYFQHDHNARNDDKILMLRDKFGAEGYGIFWLIVENMSEAPDGMIKKKFMPGLCVGIGVAMPKLQEFLDFCVSIKLFKFRRGNYLSGRVLRDKEWRKKKAELAKSAAKKRWEGNADA